MDSTPSSQVVGDMNCGHGIDIDREDWEGGYGLIRLDTTPAGSGHLDHLIPHP